MTDREQLVEQRQHVRFEVPGLSAFAVFRRPWPHSPIMGDIIDVGWGGLSFRYIASEKRSYRSSELDILMTDGSFYLNKVPLKTVSDFATDSETPVGFAARRCGVQFGDLTDNQKSNLTYFIRTHTTADPEG